MSDNLKDILSNLNPDIDQETLMRYLQNKLTDAEKHEVEKKLMDQDFEEDALEGLQTFRDKEQLAYTVEALNRDLKKKTARKKERREKLKLPDQTWTILSIIILLLLVVLSYLVVVKLLKP